MNILAWLRSKFFGGKIFSDFEISHYKKFEDAVAAGDVEVDVYNMFGYKGKVIVPRGAEHHIVTESNLVQFRKLTRRERRYMGRLYPTIGNEKNNDLHQQQNERGNSVA